jgi:hypothetical protein
MGNYFREDNSKIDELADSVAQRVEGEVMARINVHK